MTVRDSAIDMKQKALLFTFLLFFSFAATAQLQNEPAFVEGNILVQMMPGRNAETICKALIASRSWIPDQSFSNMQANNGSGVFSGNPKLAAK